mgnify:CR=1 FL=1
MDISNFAYCSRMRALIQRVTSASVHVDGECVGKIDQLGICALIGVTHEDNTKHSEKLAEKIWNIRIFEDDNGVPNLSAAEKGLPILVVSQFTLYGNTTKGRRPSWIEAAQPDVAEPLINHLVETLQSFGAEVETGRFRTDMQVSLVNSGPFTLMLEA